jgi:hypothetical protein
MDVLRHAQIMIKPLAAGILAALLLSGCVTPNPPAPHEVDNTRTYPASRDVVWDRVLASSARNEMIIRKADRENGLITVEREIINPRGPTIFSWAECGWNSLFDRAVSQRDELNYFVHRERDGTSVTVNGRYLELRLNVPMQKTQWATCVSTGVLERTLLDSFYYGAR